MFCLELWYIWEKYIITVDAAIQMSTGQHISKQIYEITEVQEIHISSLELPRLFPRICYLG